MIVRNIFDVIAHGYCEKCKKEISEVHRETGFCLPCFQALAKKRGIILRSYEQLSEEEKGAARQFFLTDILVDIIEHGLRFSDEMNKDDLQARIDQAWIKADRMQTPWFVHEYILDTCRKELEELARGGAEDAIYEDVKGRGDEIVRDGR